jgi:hypothetical protein
MLPVLTMTLAGGIAVHFGAGSFTPRVFRNALGVSCFLCQNRERSDRVELGAKLESACSHPVAALPVLTLEAKGGLFLSHEALLKHRHQINHFSFGAFFRFYPYDVFLLSALLFDQL